MLEFKPASMLAGTVVVTITGYTQGLEGRDAYGNYIPQAKGSQVRLGIFIGAALTEGEEPADFTYLSADSGSTSLWTPPTWVAGNGEITLGAVDFTQAGTGEADAVLHYSVSGLTEGGTTFFLVTHPAPWPSPGGDYFGYPSFIADSNGNHTANVHFSDYGVALGQAFSLIQADMGGGSRVTHTQNSPSYSNFFVASGPVDVSSFGNDQSLYVVNTIVPGVTAETVDPDDGSLVYTRRSCTILSVSVDAPVALPLTTRPGTKRGHFS